MMQSKRFISFAVVLVVICFVVLSFVQHGSAEDNQSADVLIKQLSKKVDDLNAKLDSLIANQGKSFTEIKEELSVLKIRIRRRG